MDDSELDRKTLLDLCAGSLTKYSDHLAIEYYFLKTQTQIERCSLTYGELDAASNRVSQALCSTDMGKKYVVGLFIPPSIQLIISIFGVMKAKLIFAPLNMDSKELVKKLASAVEMRLVITSSGKEKQVQETFTELGFKITLRDKFKPCKEITELTLCELVPCADSTIVFSSSKYQDLAYITHTSGTTNFPKIIAVPHNCIVANVMHLAKIFNVLGSSKVAMVSPPTFDASIVEMFITFTSHALLVVPSTEIKINPAALLDVLFIKAKITVLQGTPALIRRFPISRLRNTVFSETSSLAVMAFGGESCPSYSVIKSWIDPLSLKRKKLSISFFNLYGITEVSSWASYYKLPLYKILQSDEMLVPLGNPLWKTVLQVRSGNNEVFCTLYWPSKTNLKIPSDQSHTCEYEVDEKILKEKLEEGQREISGKLYIGGKERLCCIINDKYQDFIDSGDIVNVSLGHESTKLTFLGRCDKLVKRRGKKLNLLQISDRLCQVLDIESSHVMVVDKPAENAKVIAFVVRCGRKAHNGVVQTSIISTQKSKRWTFSCFKSLHLNSSMDFLPDEIVEINLLPITLNGKVDENLLQSLLENFKPSVNAVVCEDDIRKAVIEVLPVCITNKPSRLVLNEKNFRQYFTQTFMEMAGDSLGATILINLISMFLDLALVKIIPDALDLLFNNSVEDFIKLLAEKLELSVTSTQPSEPPKKQQKRFHTNTELQNCSNSDTRVLALCKGGKRYIITSSDFNSDQLESERYLYKESYPLPVIQQLWKYNTGKCVDASPLLSFSKDKYGTCFIGSHSGLFSAVSLCEGKKIWCNELPGRIESSACICKMADAEIVIVGCNDSNIYCIEASTGKLWWKYKTGREVKSSPCWLEGTSLVLGGSHDGYLHTLNIKEKKCEWKAYCGGGSVYSSPTTYSYADGKHHVFVATLGGRLLCLSGVDGKAVWTRALDAPIFSSPCVNASGVCVGCADTHVHFFDHETGNKLWCFQTGKAIFSSPSFSTTKASIIIGSHDGSLYSVRVKDGSLAWRTGAVDKYPVYSTPFPFCLQSGNERAVAFASTNGEIYVLHEDSGDILIKTSLPGEVFSSPVVACADLLPSNDVLTALSCRILVGCRDDNVYCLEVRNFFQGNVAL